MHPYMTEQLAMIRQRQLLEEAEANRVLRGRPSWLRRTLRALRRSPALRRPPTLPRPSRPEVVTAQRPRRRVDEAVAG